MFKLIAVVAAAGSFMAIDAGTAWSRSAGATLCVGGKAGCYSTIQAAVDAAHDGDTITIAAGSFAGGITIDKSVNVVGAGAAQTVISGGRPVVTIGELGATSEPTVSVTGVTITGGVNSSNPAPEVASGGGVSVPRGRTSGSGATVTISDSVITGNRAEPVATSSS